MTAAMKPIKRKIIAKKANNPGKPGAIGKRKNSVAIN